MSMSKSSGMFDLDPSGRETGIRGETAGRPRWQGVAHVSPMSTTTDRHEGLKGEVKDEWVVCLLSNRRAEALGGRDLVVTSGAMN